MLLAIDVHDRNRDMYPDLPYEACLYDEDGDLLMFASGTDPRTAITNLLDRIDLTQEGTS